MGSVVHDPTLVLVCLYGTQRAFKRLDSVLIVKWEMLLESANWKCHFAWLADIFLKVLLNILFAPALKMSKSSLTSGFYPKAGKADITGLCVWCQTAHAWVKCRLICHCLCCLFFAQWGESQQRLLNCLQYNWSCLPESCFSISYRRQYDVKQHCTWELHKNRDNADKGLLG